MFLFFSPHHLSSHHQSCTILHLPFHSLSHSLEAPCTRIVLIHWKVYPFFNEVCRLYVQFFNSFCIFVPNSILTVLSLPCYRCYLFTWIHFVCKIIEMIGGSLGKHVLRCRSLFLNASYASNVEVASIYLCEWTANFCKLWFCLKIISKESFSYSKYILGRPF